jgi:hypothetical protein
MPLCLFVTQFAGLLGLRCGGIPVRITDEPVDSSLRSCMLTRSERLWSLAKPELVIVLL